MPFVFPFLTFLFPRSIVRVRYNANGYSRVKGDVVVQIGSFDEQPGERITTPETSSLPEQVTPGIWRIPLPVPFPPGWVNAYVLHGADGWSLVDCGMGTRPSDAALVAGLVALGITFADLHTLVLTHAHPDHIGAAGDITSEMRVPRVLMLADEATRMYEIWQARAVGDFAQMRAMLMAGGLPADDAEAGLEGLLRLAQRMRLPTRDAIVSVHDDEVVTLGDRVWRIIWTPGHAEGHICLVSGNVLLAGDHILPTISPNVGLAPQRRPDPIQDYLDGLTRIAALQLHEPLVLPGHGQPFARLPERIAELRSSYERRSTAIAAAIAQQAAPMTGLQIADIIFAGRLNNGDDRRLALGETMAHLEHLRLQGRISREDRAGVFFYAAAANIPMA